MVLVDAGLIENSEAFVPVRGNELMFKSKDPVLVIVNVCFVFVLVV